MAKTTEERSVEPPPPLPLPPPAAIAAAFKLMFYEFADIAAPLFIISVVLPKI